MLARQPANLESRKLGRRRSKRLPSPALALSYLNILSMLTQSLKVSRMLNALPISFYEKCGFNFEGFMNLIGSSILGFNKIPIFCMD